MFADILKRVWHLLPRKVRVFLCGLFNNVLRRLFRLKSRIYVRKLKQFKDIKLGRRCFVIGNGPSLTISDLEKIREEDSFATNRIFQMFSNTWWRPTYYCCQDDRVFDSIKGKYEEAVESCEAVFLSSAFVKMLGKFPHNSNFFYINIGPFENATPPFAENIADEVYEGYTVLYTCIQIAVYMGYKEIYLLGVDHKYSYRHENEIDGLGSYAEGLGADMTNSYPPRLDASEQAYTVAKKYCDEHGITIKNATRGGCLEVFERIELSDLIS